MTVALTGRDLTLAEVLRVAREGEGAEVAPEALARMRERRAAVEAALAEGREVYGLTTGVGARKRFRSGGDAAAFNRRLLLEHRVGQGPLAPPEVVRAAALLHANHLAAGWAGVRPELAEALAASLAREPPAVRLLGSVGMGDVAPLADLAAGALGDLPLEAGEALALISSNAFSTALAALALADASRLLDALDAAAALDLEAFAANVSVLDPATVAARPGAGLAAATERLRSLLDGSYLWRDGAARNLQDPLSFRCVAQVHGAARDALGYALARLEPELNAHQGNPLVTADGRIVPTGSFDALALAAALDLVRIALAPVLTCAAERSLKLLQSSFSGLPEGLGARPGLAAPAFSEFGVALLALEGEARLLAAPVSAAAGSSTHHEGIEDHVTFAPLAARRLAEQVELGERLCAIELALASQAVDLRGASPLGAGTGRLHGAVREAVPFAGEHDLAPHDLEPLVELVRAGL
ncbi:MAG TPA: aromatic amino acid lyase [Gaiellaceae bacterium]|nr:aromatic amino acid lyase [Gaiellaceae bacterium]